MQQLPVAEDAGTADAGTADAGAGSAAANEEKELKGGFGSGCEDEKLLEFLFKCGDLVRWRMNELLNVSINQTSNTSVNQSRRQLINQATNRSYPILPCLTPSCPVLACPIPCPIRLTPSYPVLPCPALFHSVLARLISSYPVLPFLTLC